jgi:hypothetical protein
VGATPERQTGSRLSRLHKRKKSKKEDRDKLLAVADSNQTVVQEERKIEKERRK